MLVLTVELSTLHLQPADTLEPLLAMLQFGDGAAGALVTGALDDSAMASATRDVMRRLNPRFTNLKTPVGWLSGGQRQAVAIARAHHDRVALAADVACLLQPVEHVRQRGGAETDAGGEVAAIGGGGEEHGIRLGRLNGVC